VREVENEGKRSSEGARRKWGCDRVVERKGRRERVRGEGR